MKITPSRKRVLVDLLALQVRASVRYLAFSAHADSKGVVQLITQVGGEGVERRVAREGKGRAGLSLQR